jgi:hypothetical protein
LFIREENTVSEEYEENTSMRTVQKREENTVSEKYEENTSMKCTLIK